MTRRILMVPNPRRDDALAAADIAREALERHGVEATLEVGKEPVEAAIVFGGDGTMLHAAQMVRGTGAPLLLISKLAVHTRNVLADPRVSLMIDERKAGDPLEGARVMLMGTATATDDPQVRARYLARQPEAEMFAGFADFSFYRIGLKSAHLVAGFGRIVDLKPEDILTPVDDAAELVGAEARILEHMNADHADACRLYATKLLGAPVAVQIPAAVVLVLAYAAYVRWTLRHSGEVEGGEELRPLVFDATRTDPPTMRAVVLQLVVALGAIVGGAHIFVEQVLHVADSFEAMTAARPYRMTPLTPEQAIAELRKFAGIQFDPKVVDAFVQTHWAEGVADPGRTIQPRPIPLIAQHANQATTQATTQATSQPTVIPAASPAESR